MPNDTAPADAPEGSTVFPLSAKSVRKTLGSFATVTVIGLGAAGVGAFGVSRGVDGARFLRSSGDPMGLVILGGFVVVVGLLGLGYYTWRTVRRDGELGSLTLSPGGVRYDNEDDLDSRQSVPWLLVESWRVAGSPSEPVIEVTLLAGASGAPGEVLSLPIHLLRARPVDVVAAFTSYSGKEPLEAAP